MKRFRLGQVFCLLYPEYDFVNVIGIGRPKSKAKAKKLECEVDRQQKP